jgi:FAD/FMN-containing dehydrogenase
VLYDDKIFKLIEPYVFEWTKQFNGSISAEHGLGVMKRNYIHFSKSDLSIDYMKRLKSLFDPNFILNPYKTLPEK